MSYSLNLQEQKLIQSPITINQLSILERNTITRLQFFVHNKKNFIKSTQDDFQHLRIFILSLLIKIFQQFSQKNNKRLQTFKSIIYGSNLERIINDYGLLKQQLHKLIAVQLNKMQIGFQAQSYLLNMFNCVSFFDEILIRSVQQYLGVEKYNQVEYLQKLLVQKFYLKVIWNRQLTSDHQQSTDQLYLWRDRQRILRQSSLNMTFIGQSSSQGSLNGSCRGSIKRKKRSKSKTVMLQTVSVNESKSPFQFSSTFKKGRDQIIGGQQSGGMGSFHYSKGKRLNCQQQEQNNLNKVHLIKKGKQKKRSFWDIICCSSGQ